LFANNLFPIIIIFSNNFDELLDFQETCQ